MTPVEIATAWAAQRSGRPHCDRCTPGDPCCPADVELIAAAQARPRRPASVPERPDDAQVRAHERRQPGTCAKDHGTKADRRRAACTCVPDPADVAAIWAGRARMAAARQRAGLALSDIDRQALARTAGRAADTERGAA